MAQSAASLQAAATCSTRLSLPPKRFQLTSCSPRLIRPSEEEGRCILSSCRTHLHVQRTGWKRSLPDELPERASGLAEIRGELVPRFAGESYLATDNGPVLLNPVGNGSGTNRAALGWVHVDNECNFHYDVAVTSSGSGGSSSRPEKFPAISPSSNWLTSRGSSSNEKGGGIMLMDGSEPSAGTGSN